MKLKDLVGKSNSSVKWPDDHRWFRDHGVLQNTWIERNDANELVINGNRNHVTLTNVDDLPYPFHLKYRNLTIEDSPFVALNADHLPPETEYLNFSRCEAMHTLPDLSKLKHLNSLQIYKCYAFDTFTQLPDNTERLAIIDTGVKNLKGIDIEIGMLIDLHIEKNIEFETFVDSGLKEVNTMTIYGSKALKSLEDAPKVAYGLTLGGLPNLSFANIHKQFPGARTINFESFGAQKWKYRGPILGLLKMDGLIEIRMDEKSFANKDFYHTLTIINKHMKNKDIVEAMDELMASGLKDYAKL